MSIQGVNTCAFWLANKRPFDRWLVIDGWLDWPLNASLFLPIVEATPYQVKNYFRYSNPIVLDELPPSFYNYNITVTVYGSGNWFLMTSFSTEEQFCCDIDRRDNFCFFLSWFILLYYFILRCILLCNISIAIVNHSNFYTVYVKFTFCNL